jgi:hypothetical protein
MNKTTLIKTYQKNGDFTHQQKIDNFIKPNKDILDMITKSIDFNFRKAWWVVFTTTKRKPKTIFPVRKTMVNKLKSKLTTTFVILNIITIFV